MDGLGANLSVNRGALAVSDGIAEHWRDRRFDRAMHGLRRVVLLASTGLVPSDALHCARVSASASWCPPQVALHA
jgi:hypothetical protein